MARCPIHDLPLVPSVLRAPIRLAHKIVRLLPIRSLRCTHVEGTEVPVRCSWSLVPEADRWRNEKNVLMFSRLAKLQNPFNERNARA